MQNKTYTQLYSVIRSLCGVGNFTSEEQDSILDFVNRRAYAAYHASSVWPRYVKVGEERTVEASSLIEYTDGSLSVDDVGEFVRIHREQPFYNRSAEEYEFYVDSDGAHVLNLGTSAPDTLFVTYKKELSDFTQDSEDVPFEWFEYLAHGAYADFLRMDGQLEKALMEESRAIQYLDFSLEKAQSRSNNSTIGKKFSTYVNRQRR